MLRAVTAVAVLLAVVAASAWWLARRDVPSLDGQRSVPGLVAPVEVLFDAFAVPHVYARGELDVWLAAGYLHGRERLWQMEVYRRAASGRLSEMFGQKTLPLDRTFLRFGLRRAAAAEWQKTTGSTRAALERYALGVNYAVAEATGTQLPLEFRLVGVKPEPWTPIDSLSIAKLMSFRLSENRRGELVRGMLVARLGAYAAALLPDPPAAAPTIIGGTTRVLSSDISAFQVHQPAKSERFESAKAAEDGLPPSLQFLVADRAGASNSWVVSGRRTATGRPLLANDPHLAVEMPSVWYEAHFVAGTLDVAGVTIPGAPFVVIGHNRAIGWGIANAGADVEDFYEERVDWTSRRYQTADGWRPLHVDTFEIATRRRDHVEQLEVFSTAHGPLASEDEWQDPLFDSPRDKKDPHARWLSLRRVDAPGTIFALEGINRAASWQDFTAAIAAAGEPPLSFVYGDTAGNIGYAMSGRLPVRVGFDGGTPVAGSSGSEWRGFLDPAGLPRVLNPPSGQIVAANNEIDRERRLTRDWVAPFRAIRIHDLLGDRTGLDVDAFARLQNDVTSGAAERLLQAIDTAVNPPRGNAIEPSVRTVLDRLRLWDRRVDGRAVVSLYQAFEQALWRRTFSDEMEPAVFRRFYEYAARERYAGLYAVIDDPNSRWFDDIATVDRRESRDDVVIGAAADALTTMRRQFGTDDREWAWDRIHAVRFAHPVGAGGWPLAWWFSRGPVAAGGDDTTINKTAVDRRQPYGTIELPSYRVIMDIGGWDNSRSVITTGQSGHALSPHYFDQNPLWRAGQYHPMPFSRMAVDAAKKSRLLLVP